jgi:Secretion system C-terminal sorting domain
MAIAALSILSVVPGNLQPLQPGPFISFDVKPGTNHSVLVEWKIKAGADLFPFEVQRSRDQKNWEKLTAVPTQLAQLYSVKDIRPGEGLHYYRVRQLDKANTIAVTPVKWVQVNKTGLLYIWPNPAKDMLFIKTPFDKGRIDVMDSGGKLLFNINITALVTNMPTDRLSSGIYFIHVKNGDQILVEKFVKE